VEREVSAGLPPPALPQPESIGSVMEKWLKPQRGNGVMMLKHRWSKGAAVLIAFKFDPTFALYFEPRQSGQCIENIDCLP